MNKFFEMLTSFICGNSGFNANVSDDASEKPDLPKSKNLEIIEVHSVDYDSCGDCLAPSLYTKLFRARTVLLEHIHNRQLDRVVVGFIVPGTNRQSVKSDNQLSLSNNNGSCFKTYKWLCKYLNKGHEYFYNIPISFFTKGDIDFPDLRLIPLTTLRLSVLQRTNSASNEEPNENYEQSEDESQLEQMVPMALALLLDDDYLENLLGIDRPQFIAMLEILEAATFTSSRERESEQPLYNDLKEKAPNATNFYGLFYEVFDDLRDSETHHGEFLSFKENSTYISQFMKKILLVFVQMHFFAKVVAAQGQKVNFNFYDDNHEILAVVTRFYEQNAHLIPENVTLNINYFRSLKYPKPVKQIATINHREQEVKVDNQQNVELNTQDAAITL